MRTTKTGALIVAALTLSLLDPGDLASQTGSSAPGGAADLRVLDPRLGAGMARLLAGSPIARGVMADLAASGLTVVVGTPADLESLPDAQGGPKPEERVALLAPGDVRASPVAWVAFRVAGAAEAGTAERAWIVVDVDAMAARLGGRGERDAALLQQDVLATLAHEFVAHVGSVARTRRMSDFCDDPTPASQTIDPLGCSVRVENRVRRELNRELGLRGADRLPERDGYSLDVMNFARAERQVRSRSGS